MTFHFQINILLCGSSTNFFYILIFFLFIITWFNQLTLLKLKWGQSDKSDTSLSPLNWKAHIRQTVYSPTFFCNLFITLCDLTRIEAFQTCIKLKWIQSSKSDISLSSLNWTVPVYSPTKLCVQTYNLRTSWSIHLMPTVCIEKYCIENNELCTTKLGLYIYILFGNLPLYNGGNHYRGNSGCVH